MTPGWSFPFAWGVACCILAWQQTPAKSEQGLEFLRYRPQLLPNFVDVNVLSAAIQFGTTLEPINKLAHRLSTIRRKKIARAGKRVVLLNPFDPAFIADSLMLACTFLLPGLRARASKAQ